MYLVENLSGQIVTLENQCEYAELSFGSMSDLLSLQAQTGNVPASRFSGYTGFTFNPLEPDDTSGEYILAGMSVVIHLKNQTTNSVRLDLWEMNPKRFTSTVDFPTSVIADCVRNGFNDRFAVNSVSPPFHPYSYIYPAVWPTQNPSIMANYKLRRHKRITLLPGQTYHHSVAWRTPKLVNMTKVHVNGYDYKGITRRILMRAIGDVAFDNTAGLVSYSKSTIDYCYEVKYCTYWSPGLVAKTGIIGDGQPATGNPTFAINPVTGNINNVITNVAGVGVTTTSAVTTVH